MGPYLSSPNKKKSSKSGKSLNFQYALSQAQGWRRSMEEHIIQHTDSTKQVSIFGIFDGHFGKEVSEFVSLHFIPFLLESRSYINQNYEQSLRETFVSMDDLMKTSEGTKELLRLARSLPGNQPVNIDTNSIFSGSTGLVVLLSGTKLFVANAGDSRCVLVRDQEIIQINTEHSAKLPQEQARILNAGGFVDQGRIMGSLTTSRGFGDFEFKKNSYISSKEQIVTAFPEVKLVELTGDESFLLVGSKGLWDLKSNVEIVGLIKEKILSGIQIVDIVEDLIDGCISESVESHHNLGCDNISLILILFNTPTVNFFNPESPC